MHLPLWFILIVVYQVKHYLSDFIGQGKYMMGKFKSDWGFFLPLLAHIAVHFCGTVLITLWLVKWWVALLLGLFDATIHFIMDRIKAGPKYLGRFKGLSAKEFSTATEQEKKENTFFWWAVGFDQLIHHMTHYCIILYCIAYR